MTAIHTESAAIFGHKNVNVSEERVQYVEYKPVNPITPNTVVEFLIPGNDKRYISLKDTTLHAVVEYRIKKTDTIKFLKKPKVPARYTGDKKLKDFEPDPSRKKRDQGEGEEEEEEEETNPVFVDYDFENDMEDPRGDEAETDEEFNARWDKIIEAWNTYAREVKKPKPGKSSRFYPHGYPIDAIFHTMWNGVDVFMNHTLVSTTNTMYAYKSYMETVLNNSSATKKYQLPAIGFTGNISNLPNPINPDCETDPYDIRDTIRTRQKLIPVNTQVDLIGHLSSDVWGVQASILNGVQIGIKLYPNKDSFRMCTFPEGVEAELILRDLTLKVCKKTMSPEVIIAHNEALAHVNDATYPFIRTEVRSFTVPKGMRNATLENPYQSNIPARLIVGMVRSDSKAGHFQKNPLKFQHFDISSAGFYINDEPVPRRPYSLDPKRGRILEPHVELYSVLGKMGEDKDLGLSMEEYKDSNFFIPFDVQPTASGNLSFLAKREGGHCRLELTFSKPLPCNICIITYAIFPSCIAISLERNVNVIDLEKPFKVYRSEKKPSQMTPSVGVV